MNQNAERARTRYSNAVYRAALLRDPRPSAAAAAVVAAWGRVDWDELPLDDSAEARLIAAFPPPTRLRWSWRRRASIAPRGSAFWRLPGPQRLALGLRWLRGFNLPQLAVALKQPPEQVQTLLVDGLAALSSAAPAADAVCQRCVRARLDDPAAERGHVLGCTACRATLSAWERTESSQAEALQHTVGTLALPRAAEETLRHTLNRDAAGTAMPWWRKAWAWQLALIGGVALVLVALVWPRTFQQAGANKPLTPRQLVEQARAGYGALPDVEGVLHRRWAINVPGTGLALQAEAWVDGQNPARHRMQLMQDKLVAEWQAGDGEAVFRYLAATAISLPFCGQPPSEVNWHNNVVNRWQQTPAEQQALYAARWQSGPWAIGRRYLDLALEADVLRSLGVSGAGADAELTLAAEGPTISGTLLLRLDPISRELREVRQLQQNNGQTETLIPWRLLSSETITPALALRQGLLATLPNDRTEAVERTGPILDPICPLLGADQTVSALQTLATNYNITVGLPILPAPLTQGMVVGRSQRGENSGFEPTERQIIYTGGDKRLSFIYSNVPVRTEPFEEVARWKVDIEERVPGVFTVGMWSYHTSPGGENYGPNIRVTANGWNRRELLAVLGLARPLRSSDWVGTNWYEPTPLEAGMRERYTRILQAQKPQPNTVYHTITTSENRQPAWYAALRDPYHRSSARNPAMLQEERWQAYDQQTLPVRMLTRTTGGDGQRISVETFRDGRRMVYNAVEQLTSVYVNDSDVVSYNERVGMLWASGDWAWASYEDGRMSAFRQIGVVETQQRGDTGDWWSVDGWANDVVGYQNVQRLVFAADGTLQVDEKLALPPDTPLNDQTLATAIVLYRTTITQRQQLSAVDERVWNFTPPADAETVDWSERIQRTNDQIVYSFAAARQTVNFDFLAWQKTEGISMTGVVVSGDPPATFSSYAWGIDDASEVGLAVEQGYITADATITVITGPAAPLRAILARRVPQWTRSDQRQVTIAGRSVPAWVGVRDGDDNARQWLIAEVDDNLVYIEQRGGVIDDLVQRLPELSLVRE